MMNFQLYRTNTLLGGQMKWDIILDSDKNGLHISDFHLTPVSDHIPYAKQSKEKLLANTHLENIKNYYNRVKSNFWSDGVDPRIKSREPYIIRGIEPNSMPRSMVFDAHDTSNEMGMKRTKYYSVYNKPVEIFCPVWLEDYNPETDELLFTFNFKQNEYLIAAKSVKLTYDNALNSKDFHNRFVSYFNEYIKSIHLDGNVLKYNIDALTGLMSGVDVNKGAYIPKKNITSRLISLFQSEKLLMDADNLIITCFKNNNMIARQLFNFNFIFDYEDIFIPSLIRNMECKGFNLSASVAIKREGEIIEFPLKDFYSNYSYIKEPRSENTNMMDNICDYSNTDIVLKNKHAQNIVHWCVNEYDDYIFNMYTGFGTYGSMDVFSSKANFDWCYKVSHLEGRLDVDSIAAQTEDYIKFHKYTEIGNKWLNSIMFNDPMDKPIKMVIHRFGTNVQLVGLRKENEELKDNIDRIEFKIDNEERNGVFYMMSISDDKNDVYFIHIFISYEILNSLNFLVFKRSIYNYTRTSEHLESTEKINSWCNSMIAPRTIELKSLGYSYVEGPAPECTEVQHYTRNEQTMRISRYGGDLRPCFVEPTMNNVYYKDVLCSGEQFEDSAYKKYVDTGYDKVFPSIGYCAIKELDKFNIDEFNIPFCGDKKTPYEYKWFGHGQMLMLPPTINIEFEQDINIADGIVEDINGIIFGKIIVQLMSKYDIDEDQSKYIVSQYNVVPDWDYTIDKTDINKRKYNFVVKLTLK